MIRNIDENDIQQICDIYNDYIRNTTITFEETPVSYEEMKNRANEVCTSLVWYIYEEDGHVLGYAYASKWKGRCAYRFSVESTIYVKNGFQEKGIGSKLYAALIAELKKRKIHAIIGGVALPNDNSVRLHEKFGFKKVAHFSEVGFKFNKWIDVGYWELISEY